MSFIKNNKLFKNGHHTSGDPFPLVLILTTKNVQLMVNIG